jgi:hypothetical protein
LSNLFLIHITSTSDIFIGPFLRALPSIHSVNYRTPYTPTNTGPITQPDRCRQLSVLENFTFLSAVRQDHQLNNTDKPGRSAYIAMWQN